MNEHDWLVFYGLDQTITSSDDPDLWEMALREYWPSPDDPSIMVDSLRFGTGRRIVEGETISGEVNELTASQRAMIGVEDWHFSRIENGWLSAESYDGVTPPAPVILPGMFSMNLPMIPFAGTNQPPIGTVVFQFLTISRPSMRMDEVIVYHASSAPGVGEGIVTLWKKEDGLWRKTDTILSRWLT